MGITLREAFEKKSKSALKEVASAMNVKGHTKMSKDELTDACVTAVNRKAVFVELSYIIPDFAWDLFQKAVEAENGIKAAKPLKECAFFERVGLLYSEKSGDGYLMIVPDEIREMYRQLVKDGFLEVKRVADLIHKYAQAAVHLYGVITQDELVDIINSQNGNISDIDLNFQIFLRHIAFDADYVLWEEYIVHEDFEEDDFQGVKSLLIAAGDKPRYIPGKSEILKYSDWMYYEKNAQIKALSKFLQNKCGIHDPDIDGIMFDLHWAFANEDSVSKDFEVFDENDIVFEESQINELVELLMNCRNNTRLWENKGYTPNELVQIYKQSKPKTQKIGRNDPCPCGSGKKYKKCCGK